MNISASDITGSDKHSATNPKHERFEPSMVEKIIDQVTHEQEPEPEMIVGGPMPHAEAIATGMLSRAQVLETAKKYTNVSTKKVTLFMNAILNAGISISKLKRLATMETSPQSIEDWSEVFADAGQPGPPTKDEIEAVVAAARSILEHIHTYHGTTYERVAVKTPFIAWRMKEFISEALFGAKDRIVRNASWGGITEDDVQRDISTLTANFTVSELVLWNHDIWKAAVNGSDAFLGTQLEKEVVDSFPPMFWQFDIPLSISPLAEEEGQMHQTSEQMFELQDGTFELVGFLVMPVAEDYVDIEMKSEDMVITPIDGKTGKVELKTNIPEHRESIRESLQHGTHFKRKGISICIVFMPVDREPAYPRLRFLSPVFEEDEIIGALRAEIIAAITFLNLKYVAKDDAQVSKRELKADRALFKKVRKGKTQVPPIKIINLRRPERRERTEADEHEAKHRNYSCHWLVDAHWRKQWFPATKRHSQIRILGYVKGDMSKPFKPPREKVFKAVR